MVVLKSSLKGGGGDGGLSGRDIYFIVVYGKSERSYLKSYPSVSLHVHKANSK